MKTIIAAILMVVLAIPVSAATLIWDASTGNPEGYIVEISDDEGVTWPYIYVVAGTSLPLDDKLQYNTTYSFRVSAYNAAGVSAPCPAISWSRPAYTPPDENPMPPVNEGPASEPSNPVVNDGG